MSNAAIIDPRKMAADQAPEVVDNTFVDRRNAQLAQQAGLATGQTVALEQLDAAA